MAQMEILLRFLHDRLYSIFRKVLANKSKDQTFI